MEFKFFQKELELQSRGWIPTFHDISKEIIEIVKASGVKNGTVTIASHHTTCSVMVQECSHDIDTFDLEYLQHDLLDIMRKMIPDYTEEGDYRHPGPIHSKFGRYVNEPGDFTSMNTDGHLRSVFFGRSDLFELDSKYYLILDSVLGENFQKAETKLSDFGDKAINPTVFETVLNEYGKSLYKKNAINMIKNPKNR